MMNTEKFKPVKIIEVELSQPLPHITDRDQRGTITFQKALILTRLHSYPLGLLDIEYISGEISPIQLAIECWAIFGEQINEHLRNDGFDLLQQMSTNGIPSEVKPNCLLKREEILNEAPLISVVIATRDRAQSLAATLNSILSQEIPQLELILVDNAPKTSDTYDYFINNQTRYKRNNINLRYIREDVPGLAVAHNRGLEAVRTPLVAFTDDDVVVDKNWLVEIISAFKDNPNAGCVTGLVIPVELSTPAQVLFEEYGGFTKGFARQIFDLGIHRPMDPLFPYAAGRFGTGANMAFRTEFLLQVGGFEPALGIGTPTMGADDMEAFYKILVHRHQLVYQPSAIVHHQHRRTYQELQRQMFGYGSGLTAFLTKCALDDLKAGLEMLLKLPKGIRYAFSSDSQKNQNKSNNYPHALERIERWGMLYGPIAYIYSSWHYRKLRRKTNRPQSSNEPPLSQHYVVIE